MNLLRERMRMDIFRPEKRDIPSILELLQACALDMNTRGIHQWDEFYPNREVVESDVENESIFMVKAGQEIAGVITFDQNQSEEYKTIAWRYNEPGILVIHRLAVRPKHQKQGIAQKLMDYATECGVRENCHSIRLDTYSGNEQAVNFYKRRGFDLCGEVFFPRRELPFYCMEMKLNLPGV